MKVLDVHYGILKTVPLYDGPLYEVWRKARGFDGGPRMPVTKLIHFARDVYEGSGNIYPAENQ